MCLRRIVMRKWTFLLAGLAGGLVGPRPAAAQPVMVALSGSAAPAGGNYSSFSNAGVNASGQVTFYPPLPGGSSSEGVFVGAPGGGPSGRPAGHPRPGRWQLQQLQLSV